MNRFTYNLPTLTRGGMPDATAPGVWIAVGQLDKLADSLLVGTKEATREDIKSIPDPWAQFLVFDRALFDIHHPLHKQVRDQWRALLATIALQPEFENEYSLSTAAHDLNAAKESSLFSKTLLHLLPQRTLTKGLTWNQTTALMLHQRAGANAFSLGEARPIGFLTPTALVAAGRGAEVISCRGVPWLKDGLTDPTSVALSDRHFRILADFLQTLWDKLKSRKGLNPDLKAGLADAVKTFHDDCMEKAPDVIKGLIGREIDLDWPSALHREVLGSTQVYPDGLPADSDAQLQLPPALRQLFRGAILIDPDLATTLGKGPESVSIWKRHSLTAALQPNTLEQIRQEAEAAGWLVVRPEDIFTEALSVLNNETINEAHPVAFQSALLPLSPLAMMLTPDQQIGQAIEMTPTASAAVVRFKLKLASGKTHMVRREIPRPAAGEAPLAVADTLAFWPNFRSPNWRWTFLHHTTNVNFFMRPRFAVTADFIASQIKAAAADGSDTARLMRKWSNSSRLEIDDLFGFPGASSDSQPQRVSTIKGENGAVLMERMAFTATDTVGELHHLPMGADAVFFARRLASGDFAPAGMALVKFAEAPASSQSAKVAVDFGTTNTVVYSERPGIDKSRQTFSDRVLFPFTVRDKQTERRLRLADAHLGFFPLQGHDTPLPTVAYLRQFIPALPTEWDAKVRAGQVDQHGFADNIFFVPNFEGFISQQARLNGSSNLFLDMTRAGILRYGLKWGRTQEERTLAAHFLRQIMMMSAAELIVQGINPQSIDWRFSYPQAFSRSARDMLEKEITASRDQLFGAPSGPPEPARRFLRKTEGAAAAHYFMTKAPEKLMLMLDIGGGTTDIALWRDSKPFWRNSFRLAGGDFFTTYLANNPRALSNINMDEVAEGLSATQDLSEEGRKNFVELYVNKPSFSKQFSDNFRRQSSEPVGRGLQLAASVALAGMMYYVGLILKRFIDGVEASQEQDSVRADPTLKIADLNRMTVAFAGRGSTFFRQLHSGVSDDELAQLLKVAIAAAGVDPNDVSISVKFSAPDEAKHEVARGLLDERPPNEDRNESRLAVLGEDVEVIGPDGERTTNSLDSLSVLRGVSEIDDLELVHLRRFLGALRRLTDINIDMDSRGAFNEIRAQVRQDLSDAMRALDTEAFDNPDTQPFTPPFILALRQLVERLTLPLERRDETLWIKED